MTHQIAMNNSGRMNVFQTALSGENEWTSLRVFGEKHTNKNLI